MRIPWHFLGVRLKPDLQVTVGPNVQPDSSETSAQQLGGSAP